MTRVAVLIPVHKSEPDAMERVSLRQCGRVLAARDLILLAPEGVDLSAYAALLPASRTLRVPAHWMASREAYNRMMIAPLVYEQLGDYSHVLVHEPDAMVFRDELDQWCAGEHDYIGAPWFEGYRTAVQGMQLEAVGNFGLSLHNLTTVRRIMASARRWYPYPVLLRDLVAGLLKRDGERLHLALSALGRRGQLRHAWRAYPSHCDLFWSHVVPAVEPSYRLPRPELAVHFAWEVHPARCMALSGQRLPFGIHAWARYDLAFLWPHLEAAGVDLGGLPHPGVSAS